MVLGNAATGDIERGAAAGAVERNAGVGDAERNATYRHKRRKQKKTNIVARDRYGQIPGAGGVGEAARAPVGVGDALRAAGVGEKLRFGCEINRGPSVLVDGARCKGEMERIAGVGEVERATGDTPRAGEVDSASVDGADGAAGAGAPPSVRERIIAANAALPPFFMIILYIQQVTMHYRSSWVQLVCYTGKTLLFFSNREKTYVDRSVFLCCAGR